MIGLDTNVLVRYLTQDDPDQAARATRMIEQELTADAPGFIGLVVLVETAWVLQRLYRASPEEIRETVTDLLGSSAIVVENRDVVARALAISKQNGCGFADAIITASALHAGCEKVLSLDRGTVRAGMTRVEP
jgi:predicted nucleic-acid-binding protein